MSFFRRKLRTAVLGELVLGMALTFRYMFRKKVMRPRSQCRRDVLTPSQPRGGPETGVAREESFVRS